MDKLQVEYVPIDKVTPYERNARKHSDADVQTIVNSIKTFEMCDPIGVWGEKNIIVEGHGRLLALKQLGYDEVPVIHLDHLTNEQRRAYALAHNKTAEMSEWDYVLQEEELGNIFDIDMSDFGFEGKITEISSAYQALLSDEDYMSLKKRTGKDTFEISFVFPVSCENEIKNFISDVSKEKISEMIIQQAREHKNGD